MKSKEEIRRIIEKVVKRLTGDQPKSMNMTIGEIVLLGSQLEKAVFPLKRVAPTFYLDKSRAKVRPISSRAFTRTLQQQVLLSLGEHKLVVRVTSRLNRSPLLGRTTLQEFADLIFEEQNRPFRPTGRAQGIAPGLRQTGLKDRRFKRKVISFLPDEDVTRRQIKAPPQHVWVRPTVAKKALKKKVLATKVVAKKAGGKRVGADTAATNTTKKTVASSVKNTVMNVYFGTNRERLDGDNPRFGANRAPETTLGVCRVSIPKTHQFGQLESPASIFGFKLMPADPKKHIVLLKTVTKSERKFLNEVTKTATAGNGELFLFVHGYNVKFEDAARVTGQVAYDLQFDGAAVMFSWPSAGRILSYTQDAGRIESSLASFKRFLTLLSTECGAARINIIAHSMGNRLVCNALNELHLAGTGTRSFEHLVLAAPDVNQDRFIQVAGALTHLGKTVTLYQSSRDRAMPASEIVNGEPRAGDPVLILPGIDTIDATTLGDDLLRHSYFRESYPLLTDIFHIFRGDRPYQRVGIRPELNQGKRYYAFPEIG